MRYSLDALSPSTPRLAIPDDDEKEEVEDGRDAKEEDVWLISLDLPDCTKDYQSTDNEQRHRGESTWGYGRHSVNDIPCRPYTPQSPPRT